MKIGALVNGPDVDILIGPIISSTHLMNFQIISGWAFPPLFLFLSLDTIFHLPHHIPSYFCSWFSEKVWFLEMVLPLSVQPDKLYAPSQKTPLALP